MERDRLTLRLIGRIRLVDPRGQEVPVTSLKGQGLFALLGTAPEMRRARPFLQDKLWSDSDAEKGSASLRQLLTVLRRSLGPWRDALIAAPGWVGLDPRIVTVALDPATSDWGLGEELPEFAAGLDIRDPEFDDWLRDQRLAVEDRLMRLVPPPPSASPALAQTAPEAWAGEPIRIEPPRATDPEARSLAEVVAAEIATLLRTETGTEALEAPSGDAMQAGLSLGVRAVSVGRGLLLQVTWHDGASGRQLATCRRMVASGAGDAIAVIDDLVAEACVAGQVAIDRRSRAAGQPSAIPLITGAALSDPQALLAIDRQLAAMTDARTIPGALAFANRAQLRVIATIERFQTLFEDTAAAAVAFSRRAIETDPTNAAAKAIAAEVALFLERSPGKAMRLAEEARRLAPASATAGASYARALAYAGQEKAAHREAVRALKLATGHPRVASWYVFCATTALRCRSFEDAELFASLASDAQPGFRPPLRFLAGLRWQRGDEAGTLAALTALKAAEPDFDLAMMAEPDYPAYSLQAAGLVGVARSGLL
jgi:hypothetical protein